MNGNRLKLLVIAAGLMALAAGVASAAFLIQHHESRRATVAVAEAEFQRLRARFAGQAPLLDMRTRRATVPESTAAARLTLHSFHTVIFDTRGGERIVHVVMPYSVARVFGRGAGFRWLGELTFLDDTEFDPEPIELTLDQVERHGRGLIVDYRHPGGGQFVSWVE